MEKVYVEIKQATIADKKPVQVGDLLELPQTEALYLICLGRAVGLTKEIYLKKLNRIKGKPEKK